MLFERARLDPCLSAARARLYREASLYAERFCRRLEHRLARTRAGPRAGGAEREVFAELRRFYRLTHRAQARAHRAHERLRPPPGHASVFCGVPVALAFLQRRASS